MGTAEYFYFLVAKTTMKRLLNIVPSKADQLGLKIRHPINTNELQYWQL